MKSTLIIAALTLAAGSANAAIDTGATGNGELFFNIWWTGTGSQSYTRDLNTSIDAFDADLLDANGMNLTFAADANLNTFMTAAAGKTLNWNVVATDNDGDYRILSTFGYVNSSNLNGAALPATAKPDDTSRLTGNKVEIFAGYVNAVLAGNDSVIRNTGTDGYAGVSASFGQKIGNTTGFNAYGVLANNSEANGLKMLRIDALGVGTDDSHYVELANLDNSDNLNVWFAADQSLNFAAAALVPEPEPYTWVCGDGALMDGSCWSTGVQPISGSVVNLSFSDATDRIISYSSNLQPATTLEQLRIDALGSGKILFVQTLGTLTTNTELIGYSGNGTFSQSGGVHTVTSELALGQAGSGRYELSGTGNLNVATEYIGLNGNGSFLQLAGNHSVSGTLYLGYAAGSSGSYELSGTGTLNVTTEYVGSNGNATFTQSGGTHTVGTGFIKGIYTLSGGTHIAGTETITGSYVQTGGAHTVTNNLNLTGHYDLGGTGVLNVANENATGSTFSQTGGTHIVTGTLAAGTYGLSGGALSAGTISGGNFTLGGGSLIAGTFNGNLALNNGSFQAGTTTLTGNSSLNGGSFQTDTLNVSGQLNVNGVSFNTQAINATGATLKLNSGTVNTGTLNGGNFILDGGNLVATTTATGNLVMNSGSFQAASTTLTGNSVINGGAFQSNSVNIDGQLTHNGGSFNSTTTTIGNTARLNLNGGTMNSGTIQQNGTLQVDGASQVNGNINLGSYSTTTINSTLNMNGVLTTKNNLVNASSIGGSGTLAIGSTGSLVGQGNISVNVSNAGTVNAKSGNMILNGASFTNTGLVKNSVGSNLFIESATVNNAGNIEANAAGAIVFDAAISNNAGKTVKLLGGTLATPTLTNNEGGTVTGFGNLSGNLVNSGSVEFYGPTNVVGNFTNEVGGDLLVRNNQTLFTGLGINNGTIRTLKGTVVFEGGLINNGAYISDPSYNYFTDLIVNSTGYLVGEVGDVFFISGNFENHSAQDVLWDTSLANLTLNGTGNQLMYLAGDDEGISRAGYDKNFAWGSLALVSGTSVSLLDGDADLGGAMYVREISGVNILGDQVSNITGNGFNIYYDKDIAANAYLAGLTYNLQNGGQLMAAAPIPEAESYALMLMGFGLVGFLARRRVH